MMKMMKGGESTQMHFSQHVFNSCFWQQTQGQITRLGIDTYCLTNSSCMHVYRLRKRVREKIPDETCQLHWDRPKLIVFLFLGWQSKTLYHVYIISKVTGAANFSETEELNSCWPMAERPMLLQGELEVDKCIDILKIINRERNTACRLCLFNAYKCANPFHKHWKRKIKIFYFEKHLILPNFFNNVYFLFWSLRL